MGFLDTFKGKQYKNELEALQMKYNDLTSLMTPEMKDAVKLQEYISKLEAQKVDCEIQISELNDTYQREVTEYKDVTQTSHTV